MSGGLSRVGYVMLAVYIVLAMVLNYEVVGSARWEALKSYHHLGIAILILYALLLSTKRDRSVPDLYSSKMLRGESRVVGEA
jgi:hypothetical protein